MYLKNNTNIFSQINNRLAERKTAGISKDINVVPSYKISPGQMDNCFRLDNNQYAIIEKVFPCRKLCEVKIYKTYIIFFDKPIISSAFGIVLVDDNDLDIKSTVQVDNLKRKCYRIPYLDKFVIIPFVI